MHERSSLQSNWCSAIPGSLCPAARMIGAICCVNVVVSDTERFRCCETSANSTLLFVTIGVATSPEHFTGVYRVFFLNATIGKWGCLPPRCLSSRTLSINMERKLLPNPNNSGRVCPCAVVGVTEELSVDKRSLRGLA